jgi:RNA polymerase sigma-70 factor (ECF subfamily)
MKQSLSDQEQSVKLLFDKHFHFLVLSSLRYVNEYQQAEDIVQDVFVKLWQNFNDFEPIEDKKSYLFKAVKNSSLNYLRHMKVRQKLSVNSVDMYSTSEKSPEDFTTEDENRHKIHTAISKLPDHWREALILSKYNSLKYHEIAGEMNISQKTVEKYISKALHFLRSELKDMLMVVLLSIIAIFFCK